MREENVLRRWRSRGFSFAEVLFAVMILGIGFIMVAAMFPVAIKQTQLTVGESTVATMSRTATSVMENLADGRLMPGAVLAPTDVPPSFPPTLIRGRVWSFHEDRFLYKSFFPSPPSVPNFTHPLPNVAVDPDVIWRHVRGNLISSSDPRFAWVAMYRRDWIYDPDQSALTNSPVYNDSPFAQIIMIGVQVRNHTAYGPEDLRRNVDPTLDFLGTTTPAARPAVLEPYLVQARILAPLISSSQPPVIIFLLQPQSDNNYPGYQVPSGGDIQLLDRLSEGCFVVVSDDGVPTTDLTHGLYNGLVLRLGKLRPELSPGGDPKQPVFELVPGYDLPPNVNLQAGPATSNPKVFVVGRGYRYGGQPPHGDATSGYDGSVQDTAVYVSYVRVP